MASIDRLENKTILRVIDVVGEEKVRKILDEGVYYFYTYWPNSGYREYSSPITRFKTKDNPLEYFIFNEESFVQALLAIMGNLRDELIRELKEEDGNEDWYVDAYAELQDNPLDYSESIWKKLQTVKVEEFLEEIYQNDEAGGDARIFLLDNNMEYIFPISPKRTVDYVFRIPEVKSMLKKWGLQ